MQFLFVLLLMLASAMPAWATVYHVALTGHDTANDGSVGSPWRTGTKCASVAVAGDTCQFAGGVFAERITFPTSGAVGNPIVFQGTMGAGGSWDTIIDGSTATSGWTTAPEIGSGVWKASLGSPQALTANGKTVWRIQDLAMNGTVPQQAKGNGDFYLRWGATATTTIATGTVNVWDGIEALFGNKNTGITYLRFRNGTDPATMNVRTAPAGAVLTVNNRNNLTIKQFKIVGGQFGVRVMGTSTNTILEQNSITNGKVRVLVDAGSGSGTIIRNNTLRLDMIGMDAFPPGDRDTVTPGRQVNRWHYDVNKFLIGATEIDDTSLLLSGTFAGTQVVGNDIGLGVSGMIFYGNTTGTVISGNTFHHFSDIGIYVNPNDVDAQIFNNDWYDADHHMRIEATNRSIELFIYANRFHNMWYSSSGSGAKHIFVAPPNMAAPATSPSTIWVYHNSFAGGGWAVDMGGTGEFSFSFPQLHVLSNVLSTNGLSSGGPGPIGEYSAAANLVNSLWFSNTIPDFLLPVGLRNTAPDLSARSLPGLTAGYYVDGDPDHGATQGTGASPGATALLTVQHAGAGSGTTTSHPAGISCGSATCSATFPTSTVVTLTATPNAGFTFTGWSGDCSGTGTCEVTLTAPKTVTATFAGSGAALLETSLPCPGPSTLDATVQGSILLLPNGVTFDGDTAVLARCTGTTTYTDVVSYVGTSFPDVRPFLFSGEGSGMTGNTCTDCVSVHNGSASVNQAGSGWTLTDFHEGTTVSAATGGTSLYELLPSLCTKVVEGVVTADKLWPWPMNQRILDARVASGFSPVDVTASIQSHLGAIPSACLTTPPLPPPDQTTFVVAASGGSDANLCTTEAPCTCLSRAMSLMGPGHTLVVRGGTYTGACNRIRTSTAGFPPGTSWDAATRVVAAAGETVILQQASGAVVTLDNPITDRYLIVDGLTLDGQSSAGNDTQTLVMRAGVHHLRLQNLVLRNSHFAALDLADVNNIEVLNLLIEDTTHAGAVLLGGMSDTLLFDGNVVQDNAGPGLLAEGASLTNLTLTRNVVRRNTGAGLDLAATQWLVANTLAHTNAVGVHVRGASRGGKLYYSTVADNTGAEVQMEGGAQDTLVTNTLAVGGIVDHGTGTVQTTNLGSDPGFVGGGDYHIASGASAAVDTGTCLPGIVDVTLDGVTRPQPVGGSCDIGAYERSGAPPAPGALSATPLGSSGFHIPQ